MIKYEERPLRMSLCGTCASNFYHTPGIIIRRTDSCQVARDLCDYCCYRYGYEYDLLSRSSGERKHSGVKNRTLEKKKQKRYSRFEQAPVSRS